VLAAVQSRIFCLPHFYLRTQILKYTKRKVDYNNINSQLDATITNFIDNYNQLNMFRAIISSILRSIRLCLQLVVPVQRTGHAASRQHRRCIILTQSSAPEDGRNYRPKHAELTVIINKICYCCI